jgi:glycosyltransferase involved in cell wall biosynthesis
LTSWKDNEEIAGQGEIVLLPSNRQEEMLRASGETLNRLGVPQALEQLGFRVAFLDVHAKPWNPLAGRPSLFSSIDPLRACDVLFRHRRALAIISYYQSGVLLVLALRRLLGFKPKVAIIDIGDDVGWRVRARIVEYCIARADAVFTFASEQASYLRRKYGTANVHFLRQQVDTTFFSPGAEEKGNYLLSVGGDVSRDYGTLQQAVFELGLPIVLRTNLVRVDPVRHPHIKVITERQSDAQLRDLYRGARIVVLPLKDMLHPGGITTLLEAFACGNAVVVSNSRGVRDYLRDGENCLVVPSEDPAALRAAVERLLADSALRERLGRGARAYAQAELSQERHAERLAGEIRRLGNVEKRMAVA